MQWWIPCHEVVSLDKIIFGKVETLLKKYLQQNRSLIGFASREFPPGKFPGNPKFSFPVSREIFLVISREIREILSNIYSRNMGNFNEFSSILTKRNTYFYILVVKVHHSRSIFHEYFESRFFIWIGLHWYHQRLCYLSTSQIQNSYMTV